MLEKTEKKEYLYKGKIITVRKDWILMENGKHSTREVVEHNPSVVMVPFQPPDTLYLVRQYRKPAETELLEFPAGIMEDGEDPLLAATRELKEETGFTAKTWAKIGEAFLVPGFCDEYSYFFLAKNLTKGATQFDEDENLTVESYGVAELESMIENGKLLDCKTIALFYWAKRFFI